VTAGRDRCTDPVRVVAILAVVLGHWPVAVLAVEDGRLLATPLLAPALELLGLRAIAIERAAEVSSCPAPTHGLTRMTTVQAPAAGIGSPQRGAANAARSGNLRYATVRLCNSPAGVRRRSRRG